MSIAFNPKGDLLVAGDNAGSVAAWETKSWKLVRRWKTMNTAAASIAFAPDGKSLAIADAGTSRISLLDPQRAEIVAFDGVCKRAFSVAFAASGTRIVTGCLDGSLELFDAATHERLGSLPDDEDSAEPDFVNALARDPASDRFVAGTEDGRVMIWTLDPAFWMRRACRRANRDATATIAGWSGEPLVPCSAILKNAPSDEQKPDVRPPRDAAPRIPDNVAGHDAPDATGTPVRNASDVSDSARGAL
jgi:WD40 repeat protein